RLAAAEAGAAGGASGGVSRAAAALMLGGGEGGDPWAEVVPYSASSLATMATEFGHSLPTPSSPHGRADKLLLHGGGGADGEGRGKKRRKTKRGGEGAGGPGEQGAGGGRRRELSPPPTASTSLAAFGTVQPLIPHVPAVLRTNALRRQAAGYIAYSPRHPELAISSDSLFGSLPYAIPLRQSTLPPGFLPDVAPTIQLHPFNTNLPWTISAPVPYHPSTYTSHLPAPPPNARIPAPLSSIARELSFPLQFDPRPSHRDQLHPNIPLFARLRRIGPPGPLGSKGEALNYEYVGQTALVALSGVDWPERRHNAKLPKRFGEDDQFSLGGGGSGGGGGVGAGGGGAGGAGGDGTGIKLKLGGGTAGGAGAGRQTREGSMVAIGTPWNTFGGSPAPLLGGGGGATPGPSSAFLSTGDPVLDEQLAVLSASLPPVNDSLPAFATPQADFDYPDFLLGAGGFTAGGSVPGADEMRMEVDEPAQGAQPAASATGRPPGPPPPRPPPPPPPPPPPAAGSEPAAPAPAPAGPAPAATDPPAADAAIDPSLGAPTGEPEAEHEHEDAHDDGVEDAVQKGIEAALWGGGAGTPGV
ncbi:uncharacterized protein JCM10292_003648, partial [Rhodotorula paludigena]|uniref:uncharacterized protein n=1 Tax=Rhodotorula paludigena TaxID=86838 RepID=UPI00318003CF